ncbi:adenosine deaminase [Curvivirga aplysinae]|uniref:adenosine deaminase n=1 Tax=Curvivirga aplysinae TaxID=2529852 RepID=UPI0012BCC28F|nr:adenosine deaminase [Curvivirga aplysinae]MTI10555.1 adenosine deaminase [Curvivirga aplysinae]
MQTQNIPKVELHVHIEGTITPSLAKKLATRNGVKLDPSVLQYEDHYTFTDFLDFLNQYDMVADCIRTPQDYEDLVYDYLERCAAENVIYVEFFGSKDHGEACGISYPDMVAGMAKGIERAEADFGIICRCIMTCVRHYGHERALPAAQAMIDHPHPIVVGLGMAGDENAHHPKDFAAAFNLVHKAGYPTTAHAGEAAGPQSVKDCLKYLPIKRIGHGVRSIEDPALVKEIVQKGIALELCPGSNLSLGFYDQPEDHPILKLKEAGCRMSLNSDDPPYFMTTIGMEYENGMQLWGLTEDELRGITKMAIEDAFCDDETKAKLLAKLG